VRARAGALYRPSRSGAGPRRSAEAGGLPPAPEATVERRWDSVKERRAGVLTGRLERPALPAKIVGNTVAMADAAAARRESGPQRRSRGLGSGLLRMVLAAPRQAQR
jgi:hypothetical protein